MNADPVASGGSAVRYRLLGRLGRGGMATVYLAKRTLGHGLERLYAIKKLHPHLAEDPEYVEMFLDEARLASRLSSRSIVGVFEVGQDKGVPFVVMEYVEGAPVSLLMRDHGGPMPPEIAVSVTLDLLVALDAAHTALDEDGAPLGIVHRDVAPANVLVGVDGVARLTDFGIAKATARLTDTETGVRKGRLDFMAPEQLTDLEELTQQADLFAAGAFLWTVLVGRSLFRGEHEGQTIQNLLHGEIKPPSKAKHSVPAGLDRVVMRALERDPRDRYATAREMAEDLRMVALETKVFASPSIVGAFVRRTVAETLQERQALIRAEGGREGRPSDTPITERLDAGLFRMSSEAPTTTTLAPPATTPRRLTGLIMLLTFAAALGGVLFAVLQPPPPAPVGSQSLGSATEAADSTTPSEDQATSAPAPRQLHEQPVGAAALSPEVDTGSDVGLGSEVGSGPVGSGADMGSATDVGSGIHADPGADSIRDLGRQRVERQRRAGDDTGRAAPTPDSWRAARRRARRLRRGQPIRQPASVAGPTAPEEESAPAEPAVVETPPQPDDDLRPLESNPYLRGAR